jgi:hypothetical protein
MFIDTKISFYSIRMMQKNQKVTTTAANGIMCIFAHSKNDADAQEIQRTA